MILFLEDWKKHPKARIHYETKNPDFIRLAALLKRMGIKNHAFFLAIHNPLIAELDPWDPNLTDTQISMIIKESKENFWYFIREVVRIPAASGSIPFKFKPNRANIATFWLFFNHITSLLIQPRQTGKSLTYQLLFMWLLTVGVSETNLSILTKDDKLRDDISLKIRDLADYLPPYMKSITKRDVKNSEKITCKLLNNVIKLYVGRNDPKAADNVGRGITTPIIDIDEFAYVPNIHITLPVILASTTAAREQAEEHNLPYGTIFTTTPGKLNTSEGRFAYSIYQSALRWSEKLYDAKNRKKLIKIVKANSRGVKTDNKQSPKVEVILLEFNHRQLGFTDEWLKERIAATLSSGEQLESDFFNKWVGGGSNSPISKEVAEIIRKSIIKEPRIEISDRGYILRWYKTEEEVQRILRRGYLVMGLDTSDAVGKDDIALVIRDNITGSVVAAGNYNETNLIAFSDFITDLLIKYNNIILVPERRSSASTMIDYIIRILHAKGINPLKKIFNWIFTEPTKYKNKEEYKDLFLGNMPSLERLDILKKHFGFGTSGTGKTSRNVLYGNVFNTSVKYTGDKVKDNLLANELLGLQVKNGRIDHVNGGHDDMVIAWLLGYWFISHPETKKYYGLNESETLKEIQDTELMSKNINISPEELRRQHSLKEKLIDLIEQLKNEQDMYKALIILKRIKMIERKIDKRVISNFNLENLLSEIKLVNNLKKRKMISI